MRLWEITPRTWKHRRFLKVKFPPLPANANAPTIPVMIKAWFSTKLLPPCYSFIGKFSSFELGLAKDFLFIWRQLFSHCAGNSLDIGQKTKYLARWRYKVWEFAWNQSSLSNSQRKERGTGAKNLVPQNLRSQICWFLGYQWSKEDSSVPSWDIHQTECRGTMAWQCLHLGHCWLKFSGYVAKKMFGEIENENKP